ncbi:MAG: hypothetical protein E7643_02190 [Ruminococcaceae bacterium]|nr:hypothetical protein [Oscillospiraceae bacterium]
MTVTLLSVIVVGLIAIVVAIQAHKGYKRGLVEALIHLALFVLCLLGSIALSPLIARPIAQSVVEMLRQIVLYEVIVSWLPVFSVIAEPVVQMLISLVVFLPLTFVLLLLSKLVLAVFRRRRRRRSLSMPEYTDENAPEYFKDTHKAGAWVGAVSGLLLSIVLLTPFLGTLSTADRVFDFCEHYGLDMQAVEKEKRMLKLYSEDCAGTVVRFCGGDLIFDAVVRADFNGETVSLKKELDIIENFELGELQKILSRMNSLDEETMETFREQLAVIEDSFLLRAMTAQTLSWASGDWLNGQLFFGVPKPNFGDEQLVDPMMEEILAVCQNTTYDTVVDDLQVLMDLAQFLCEMRDLLVAGDYLSVMQELSDGELDRYFRHGSHANLKVEMIEEELKELAVRALIMEVKNAAKYSGETYQVLLGDLATSLNSVRTLDEKAMTATLNAHVKKHFKKVGVTLSSNMTGTLAEELTNSLLQQETIDASSVGAHFDRLINP